MNNSEILENIERLQYAIDMYIAKGRVIFQKEDDLKMLEKIYDQITGRQYNFCKSCGGSAIHEALIIVNNWKNRELKKLKTEAETKVNSNPFNPEIEKNNEGGNLIDMTEPTSEQIDEFKTKVIEIFKEASPPKTKSKSNGRGKRK